MCTAASIHANVAASSCTAHVLGSSNLAAIAEACKLLRAANTPSACDLLRLRMLQLMQLSASQVRWCASFLAFLTGQEREGILRAQEQLVPLISSHYTAQIPP